MMINIMTVENGERREGNLKIKGLLFIEMAES